MRDLLEIRNAAMEDGSYGAAVNAEMGRAKLAGLLIEKKEIRLGRIDQMDREEVEARLQALIDNNQLAPQLYEKFTQEEDQDELFSEQYEDAEYEEIEEDPSED